MIRIATIAAAALAFAGAAQAQSITVPVAGKTNAEVHKAIVLAAQNVCASSLSPTPLRYYAIPGCVDDTVAIAEGREELRQVMANLEHLSEDRREALIMRFALGMDNREIARALGKSDGATKVLIHRAIKQLQEEMSDE